MKESIDKFQTKYINIFSKMKKSESETESDELRPAIAIKLPELDAEIKKITAPDPKKQIDF